MGKRLLMILVASASLGVLVAQLVGTDNPTDAQILQIRIMEGGSGGAGVFDIASPPPGTVYTPVKRVPRNKFGVVGAFPLQLQDLDNLVYPDATAAEKQQMFEGMQFFTTAHLASEGAGPMANQPFCLGCHMNTADAINATGLLNPANCVSGSTCVSLVSRAARSTPTNFSYTSLDPNTGGGVPPGRVLPAPDGHPDPTDNLDAVNGPGRTAAFTTFGDFNPTAPPNNGVGDGFFDPLDNSTVNPVTGKAQSFGGFVQHVRPSLPSCLPKPIPPVKYDANLQGTPDPVTGLDSNTGFRRTVGERAGPPYIGRGLMEAIPTADLAGVADPNDAQGSTSSLDPLGAHAAALGCTSDCIAGKANMIPRNLAVNKDSNGNVTTVTGFVGGMGRFGLRANGAEMLQFIIGGLQGELSFTSNINTAEIVFPMLFPPGSQPTPEPAACLAGAAKPGIIEAFLSTPISERHFIRNTAPPEFGAPLLRVLNDPHAVYAANSEAGMVKRGAQLFGIDLQAFANRMVAGQMPPGGDGLDPNAINRKDVLVGCVGCHIPVQRTGQSPASVGAEHLSYVWAPIFSDLLLHKMPVIDAEHLSPVPRNPFLVFRLDAGEDGQGDQVLPTYDLTRNFADDSFSNLKALADGREFRTAPLMGMGRIGPPFLHDGRVFLSSLTANTTPAGTVTTNSKVTNAPLVVRSLEDAILAAIEMHDLPAPDDRRASTSVGGGCPLPPANTNINYPATPSDVICPPYDSTASKTNRSDSREVIRRFRALKAADQQAMIEFLKQL